VDEHEATVERYWPGGGGANSWRETWLSATLSTTKPTGTGLGLNPCLRGERAVTNRLNHDTTQHVVYVICNRGSRIELAQNRSPCWALSLRILILRAGSCLQEVSWSRICSYSRAEVPPAMWMKIQVFWNVTTFWRINICRLLEDRNAVFIFSIKRSKKMWSWLTLKMVELRSFETSVIFYQSTRHNVPEDFNLQLAFVF
jgi:hypothetical protein